MGKPKLNGWDKMLEIKSGSVLKKIVFLADTEYHLMVSIHLAFLLYQDDEHDVLIYYWVSKSRLNFSIHQLQDFNGQLIPLQANQKPSEVKQLAKLDVTKFIFFQESNPFIRHLACVYKKRGASIALAPDGYKPYVVIRKRHELISMLRDTFNAYKLLLKNRIWPVDFTFFWNYRYGSFAKLDELYLQNLSAYKQNQRNIGPKLIAIPSLSEKVLDSFRLVFNVGQGIGKKEGVLFFINQPLWSDALIALEIESLKFLQLKFPHKELFIKLHPHTSELTVQKYKSIKNVVLIKDNKPAELYLSLLSKSIVFSGWSAALLFHVPGNNYYYLFELFKNLDDKIIKQLNFVTFPHIKSVQKLDEITFPL